MTPLAFASHVHRSPTAGTAHRVRTSKSSKAHISRTRSTRRSHRLHGQQQIDSDRVTQIQQALIREHYLSGDPSGKWDDATLDAMKKFQSDNGWQTRLAPDSRALVKLGLGPDYSNAINAQNASFNTPPPVNTIPAGQVAGFEAASGAN
jgi:peptidoglycan hydrolase-like protein with peptidoglycan-binding domain